jgi:hypothetical protein
MSVSSPEVLSYGQFVGWVQNDLKKDRIAVNRKVFSVVLWCLILPILLTGVLFTLRKLQWIEPVKYLDSILLFPPFAYAVYSIWPTIRDFPKAFQKGSIGAMLEESLEEVRWRESTSQRLQAEVRLTSQEWSQVLFHLEHDLDRMRDQNRYMTILTAVVLFFMFQFLDLGGADPMLVESGPAGLVKVWVDQFSQWSIQVISLVLFSSLFYLSGLQFQRYLYRYSVCVQKLIRTLT